MSDYAFHPEALVDLKEIWDFIVQDNQNAADKVNDAILAAVAALVPLPHQGHRRPDLTKRPLRFITVYDYLVAYAPDESPLWVAAILHGSRSPRLLASILRDREYE
jgi:plasmid stabilization system protein ParE